MRTNKGARGWILGAAALAFAAIGCSGEDGPGPDVFYGGCQYRVTCEPGDLARGCAACSRAELVMDLGACTEGLSVEEVEADLALPVGFVDSLEVIDDAEVLGDQLATDFRDVLLYLAYEPDRDQLQAPFEHDGKGVYTARLASAGDSKLEARFLFGADYEAGTQGGPMGASVFRTESYLTGAEVAMGSYSASITFTGTGPLVELLGLGAAPVSPVMLELGNIEVEIRKQVLESVITVDESSGKAGTVRYSVRTTRPVLPLLSSAPEEQAADLESELLSSEIASEARGQTATLDAYARATHVTSAGVLTRSGSATLSVHGGAFDHVVLVQWAGGDRPRATFACAP